MLGTGLNLLGPWIVARAIDDEIRVGDWNGLVWAGAAYVVVLLVNLGITYAARIGIESTAQGAMQRVKVHLFDHLIDHDLAFHDAHPSGRLITRIQSDTEALRVLFSEVILSLPADVLLFVGMFGVMFATSPELALYVGSVIPPYLALLWWFRRAAPPRFLAVRKVQAALTGFWAEHTRAMPMLQLLGRAGWVRRRGEEIYQDVYDAEVKAHLLPVYYFNGVFLVRTLGMAFVICMGAWGVSQGTMTIGTLVMGLGYLRLMFNPLMRLSQHLTTIERARAAAVRIAEIMDTRPTIADPDAAPEGPSEPRPWPGLRDALRLEGVDFEYEHDNPVLRDVSIEIPAGSHIGIVGPTGSGKSTLLNLLLRFRDPTSGRVSVDGIDLRDMRVCDLRSRMGLVLQDVRLFAGTVLENLGGDREAARRACDVLGLDIALDHTVKADASNLSRGERQLVTFARALVDDPEVLVLDEATSAVDPETEIRVQAAVLGMQEGRTMVTVAHRLATVKACDDIFVLKHGRIVERGTHTALLAEGGVYAALWELQRGDGDRTARDEAGHATALGSPA